MPFGLPRWLITVVLLVGSNTFMTFAWYFHLKKKDAWPLFMAIGISWLIALPEYLLQVPANRIGHMSATGGGEGGGGGGGLTTPQLKILQECITLVVFLVFSLKVMGDTWHWRDGVAMGLVLLAVVVAMWGRV
ncbi:MAG: DMT family protein [Phycisphaerales bacterium]|nr:MAG: DMT family protein [Phycisphaerales bacterium]